MTECGKELSRYLQKQVTMSHDKKSNSRNVNDVAKTINEVARALFGDIFRGSAKGFHKTFCEVRRA